MCSNYRPASPDALRLLRPDLAMPVGEYAAECYPGRTAPVLLNTREPQWTLATFGMVPHWGDAKLARSTYNARSETIAAKPSFRHAWKERQLCVVPLEGFYEPCYESGKPVRWRIARTDGAPFGVAGIWETRPFDDGPLRWSFSMVTTNADGHPLMQRFHKPGDEKRSIVVLEQGRWDLWLQAAGEPEARELLRSFDAKLATAVPAPRGGS